MMLIYVGEVIEKGVDRELFVNNVVVVEHCEGSCFQTRTSFQIFDY